jgi:hypothetical protein
VARNDPPDYGATGPAADGNHGYGGNRGAEPEPEPVPRWRKPMGLLGIGLLIAVLIGLIIFGVLELMHGPGSTPTPTTSTTTTTTVKTTSSPTTTSSGTTTPSPTMTTTIPSGLDTDAPTTGSSQPHHLPHLPHF